MYDKNDNALKYLRVPNTNYQKYQNNDKSKNKYEFEKIHYKFKDIIQDIINIKSNLALNKIEIQEQINNNLFIPYSFKNKRIYKNFKLSNPNFIDGELKLKVKKIKEEKSKPSNIENNLGDTYININKNINISPANQPVNKSSNINYRNISPSKDINNFSDNCNKLNFLGLKRNLENEQEIDKNKLIYDEIKKMYNEYLNNNKNKLENINIKIYSNENEYFKIQETIIINNEPIYIVYLINEHITKIFSINEEKNYNDEENINKILKEVKSKIEKITNNGFIDER